MENLKEIINIILPIFFLVGLGYLLKSIKFISEEFVKSLNRFIFFVSTPLLLFRSAATATISESFDISVILVVSGITVFAAVFVYILCFRADPSKRGIVTQGVFRSNLIYFGLVVIENAFGERGVAHVVYLIAFLVPLYNLVGIFALILPQRKNYNYDISVLKICTDIIKNPLVIGSIAGFLFSVTGMGLPASADESLLLMGRTALPLALIVVGASLDFKKLRGEIRMASLISVLKLIVFPGIVYITLAGMGESGVELQAITILVASPTSVSTYVMTAEMKGDSHLAASVVVFSTLLSFFTVTGWFLLFAFVG
jgi:hypothetical protein